MFQSSPGPQTGCNPTRRPPNSGTGTAGFNPHPARRPGATIDGQSFSRGLIREFQSSPGPQTGCNMPWDRNPTVINLSCFNPHPARRPGATPDVGHVDRRDDVSILTRPADRVQLARQYLPVQPLPQHVSILTRPADRVQRLPPLDGYRREETAFQSSPGPQTGCNYQASADGRRYKKFQSSPGPQTGCNATTLNLAEPPSANNARRATKGRPQHSDLTAALPARGPQLQGATARGPRAQAYTMIGSLISNSGRTPNTSTKRSRGSCKR